LATPFEELVEEALSLQQCGGSKVVTIAVGKVEDVVAEVSSVRGWHSDISSAAVG